MDLIHLIGWRCSEINTSSILLKDFITSVQIFLAKIQIDRGCVIGLFIQLLCWENLLMMNLKIIPSIFLTVARK
ncbi:hypothetical protein P8452_50041 [Trifolium repens]|nr:hypothetical protein P8452_50041 [Trifolium repens]